MCENVAQEAYERHVSTFVLSSSLACRNGPLNESERAKLLDEAPHLRVTARKWHFIEPEPLDSVKFLLVEPQRLLATDFDDLPERNVPMPRG